MSPSERLLIEKLIAFATAHEHWEGRVILDGDAPLLDNLGDELYEGFMAVQAARNEALKLARSLGLTPPAKGIE